MKKIGFIGLGHMGSPMVKNLLKNEFTVYVYDINQLAIQEMQTIGAISCENTTEVTKNADAVITMLQTGDQVKQCCFGMNGIFANLKKGGLFIDCSSIDITQSRELHDYAKNQKIAMLDAPVSGGVAAATAGTLTFMVGGEERYFQSALPILNTIGKKIIYAGNSGSGVAAKICNNMILGVSMIAISEAFALAKKLDLDPKKFFEIANNASGQCWALSQYCPWPDILPNVPSSHDYQPGFTAKMMLKDLELSQNAAESAHAETPLSKSSRDLYDQFVKTGQGDLDFSAIIQRFLR